MGNNNISKAPCRKCLRETKHRVLRVQVTEDSAEVEGHGPISWRDRYEMLECCGCETVCLRHSHWFSEDPDVTVAYHPPPVSRPVPHWRYKLPFELGSVLDEVYAALHADSRRLALMGARTVLDIVLLDKVGDVGAFPQKLEELERQGLVARRSREFLAAALDAGNAAAHRGFQPKADELAHVMDIVENLLQAVYILEHSADALRKATPQRRHKNVPPS